MAKVYQTVDDAISQVRSQLDELNVDAVDDVRDILPAMNRAQDYATQIYASRYPEPILTYTTLDLISGQAEYAIPEDSFEDNITKLEITIAGAQREIHRVSYRDISNYESSSRTNLPYYYAIVGRRIRMIPTPTGVYNARLWYLRQPETLVRQQGRVTHINTAGNYVLVDAIGPDVTTQSDKLTSYVNVVDGQTGFIRGTLQVQSIAGNKVTFRSSPIRSTVLNRDISSSLTADMVSEDDYLAPIQGTCVVQFGVPTTNFIIQFAVNDMTRKLGGAAELEADVLSQFEKQVERVWVGREQTVRVKKRSQSFGVPTRRWFVE